MSSVMQTSRIATKRSRLKIHEPAICQPSSVSWLINGYPATVMIWTAEEWAILDDRPVDAQPFPNGIWCVLRID